MVSVSICGIRGRNILVAHGHIPRSTSNISHPTSHTHHLTSNTPHSTFSTSLSACEISVPILRTGGAICVVDKHPAWFLCRSVASAGEIFLCRMAHSPFRRSPCEGHIPHSQHSSPKSTLFFPVAPRPASKYAILTASLQPPDNQPFTIQSFPRHLPNAPFPTTKRHLSTHDPCPFEAPSLTFRTSIPKPPQPDTCPTPAPPLAYGLSTRSHSASQTSKPRLPSLCFTQNSDTRFAPNIFNVVWFSSYRLLGVERGMIYQVDSWIDGLGMMKKCYERSTFAVVAQSAAVEQATE